MRPVNRFWGIVLLCLAYGWGPDVAGAHRATVAAAPSPDRRPALQLTYDVSLAERHAHLYRITMRLEGWSQPSLQVSLPAWNALYQIRDFSQYLRHLRVRDGDGRPLPYAPLDKQTWRIDVPDRAAVEIRYDILANASGSYNSEANADHAFFNGANLFLYLVDYLDTPATLRIRDIPSGWKVATALPRASESAAVFRAENYDQLVDCPFEIGRFEQYDFDARGARFHVIFHGPHGSKDKSKASDLLDIIQKIVVHAMDLMHDVPFKEYTFIYHIGPQAGGGMEHRNSAAIGVTESSLQGDLHGFASVTAHEFFHLWNVKRIRPRVFDRLDYGREVYTKALWFSEGGTSYMAALILLRSGLAPREKFYASLAREVETLQNRPGRQVQSVEDASWYTWYDKYPAFRSPDHSVSYYNKGMILSFLLDLKIRAATAGRRGLDDVFRFMNQWFAKWQVGFEEHEIGRTLNALSGQDFGPFYAQYISGTAELPYDELLNLAGLKLEPKEVLTADAGFNAKHPFGQFDRPLQVTRIRPGSPAERAGLQVGDEMMETEGLTWGDRGEDETPRLTGQGPVHLKVRRRGQPLDVTFTPDSVTHRQYGIRAVASPTPQQLAVREGLLTGK